MKQTFLILFVLATFLASAVNDTLVIKRISVEIEGETYPVKVFQRKGETGVANAFALYPLGTQVNLYIENQDDITHQIEIFEAGKTKAVNPNDRVLFSISVSEKTLMSLKSADSWQQYYGLSMPLIFRESRDKIFLWNYRSMQKEWYEEIDAHGSPKSEYLPTAFTINNRSYPNNMNDTLTMVKGHVGDSIEIVMYNSSPNHHALHFHGYHAKVLKVTKSPFLLGLKKDTFPIKPGEMMLFLVVPDKPGVYHVHDHNLVATTIGGNYPGGMMAHMHIMP